MVSAYDRGFRKVTTLEDLVEEQPKLFRSGGETLILLKSGNRLFAADATACIEESVASPEARLASVARAFQADRGGSRNWIAAIEARALPVELRDGEIWICVDPCAR
jgi:nitrite reductase/ring-hydroxylating ferredoxin subunit